MRRAHLENIVGAALGLLGVIAAPLLAAGDWVTGDWSTGTLLTLVLDVLIWGAGAVVLYLYGVRGTGGGRW